MGYNIDIPWKNFPKKDRDWILFTEDQPQVAVYAGFPSAWNALATMNAALGRSADSDADGLNLSHVVTPASTSVRIMACAPFIGSG